MSSLAEYFAEHRPEPKYQFGTRVDGIYQGIPFVGTVYGDNLRNQSEGPMLSIHLDLPIQHGGQVVNFIRVNYRAVKGIRV